jgi:acyl-coenzyme A synthetase/AMP-(fatty) acid ligase
LRATAVRSYRVYETTEDSPAFWLYTSAPRHAEGRDAPARFGPRGLRDVRATVLGIRPGDRTLSAAKAFFAYGLGNSVLFPLSVGAAAVLEPAPARPDALVARAGEYGATLFFAGPTFFANMLRADLPASSLAGVRLAVSAGEALPAGLYQRWTGHFGIDIIDGIGMTETLHIFLSNRPGSVRAGTTGSRCPGTNCASWTSRGRRAGRLAGNAAGAGGLGRDRVLVALCRVPAGLRRRMGPYR